MALKLRVTQVKSGIGGTKKQRLTLKGLGLTRMGRSAELVDNQAVRGMIRKVAHLVTVEPVE
jgi:large subunit ribosomal protein L30